MNYYTIVDNLINYGASDAKKKCAKWAMMSQWPSHKHKTKTKKPDG
jgi:hypothetical protein